MGRRHNWLRSERVRKGVILGTEHGSVWPGRRTFEIRWASAYLIQKARVLQEAQGKPETEGHSQKERV